MPACADGVGAAASAGGASSVVPCVRAAPRCASADGAGGTAAAAALGATSTWHVSACGILTGSCPRLSLVMAARRRQGGRAATTRARQGWGARRLTRGSCQHRAAVAPVQALAQSPLPPPASPFASVGVSAAGCTWHKGAWRSEDNRARDHTCISLNTSNVEMRSPSWASYNASKLRRRSPRPRARGRPFGLLCATGAASCRQDAQDEAAA